MPGARYYREQAQLLPGCALATSEVDYATLLTTRAMELLAKANEADRDNGTDLNRAIAEFNDSQMGPRPAQQQQQIQRRAHNDDKDYAAGPGVFSRSVLILAPTHAWAAHTTAPASRPLSPFYSTTASQTERNAAASGGRCYCALSP